MLGNRPDCECHESRDIGEYDTCPHGCVYCYAVRNHGAARDRHRDHDPESEFLFDPRGNPWIEGQPPAVSRADRACRCETTRA